MHAMNESSPILLTPFDFSDERADEERIIGFDESLFRLFLPSPLPAKFGMTHMTYQGFLPDLFVCSC
jgi:hypothetical protein